MKRFEYYTTQESLTDNALNKLGRKGWELITHSVGGYSQYYVFKRELIIGEQ